MSLSLSQAALLVCRHCQSTFSHDVWVIIDTGEKPELRDAVQEETIHDFSCPHCGQIGQADAPLLVHQPDKERTIFSPPQASTHRQDDEIARRLLALLARRFCDAPPAYLSNPFVIPRHALPDAINADNMDEFLNQTLQQAAEESLRLIMRFVEAPTLTEAHRVLREHPELLGEQAGEIIDDLIEFAQEQGHQEMLAALLEAQELRAYCAQDVA